MGFLKNLFGGGKSAARDEHAMFYYVQCKKCGEKVRVRVDARWDLDQEYEGQGDLVSGYVARKEVMGNKCFRMIKMTIHYNSSRIEVEREVEGGEFITQHDFEQSQQQ